nr:hypothetical protein [Tanacetum cinerariifolium]
MEEIMSKFMSELAKRNKEKSNVIKEIQASTNASIRKQGASIKTLEIQIGEISKVLQERGFGSLPGSTEANPRDHVKSISTTIEADTNPICRIGLSQYAVSTSQNCKLMYKTRQMTIPFLSRLKDYYSEEEKGKYGPHFMEANSYGASHIDNTMPRKEKNPKSFTLPCYINNVCFDNALADLGASVSVMPLLTYLNSDMDAYHDEVMGDVIFGESFFREVGINVRQFEGMITIYKGNDEVTYQMVRSHPKFKHYTNVQCNKIPSLLKASDDDKMNGISHSKS